jgi:hypothetical protein
VPLTTILQSAASWANTDTDNTSAPDDQCGAVVVRLNGKYVVGDATLRVSSRVPPSRTPAAPVGLLIDQRWCPIQELELKGAVVWARSLAHPTSGAPTARRASSPE